MPSLEKSLSALKKTTVMVANGNDFPEPGMASIVLSFSDGTRLNASYWRLIKDDRSYVSSFDHLQKYGLPDPIDAVAQLTDVVQGKIVSNAHIDRRSGDLFFDIESNLIIEIFNFTSYEIWEIRFPDGTGEYSNYV